MSNLSHCDVLVAGERLLQRGDHAGALSVFESILIDDPENVDALVNLGVAALQCGDVRRGIEAHLNAFRIDSSNESVQANLSVLMEEPDIAAQVRAAMASFQISASASASASVSASASASASPRPEISPLHSEAAILHRPTSGDGNASRPRPLRSSPSPIVLSDYRVDRDLGVVLKREERLRDYVDLHHYLSRTDVDIPIDNLIDYLQFTFQKACAAFFNSTRVSEGHARTIQLIQNRMRNEHGASASVSSSTPSEFIFDTYHFLKSILPSHDPTHRIRIRSDQTTLRHPDATDDLRMLYGILRTSFEPLANNDLISLFVVHGSLSTLDFTPFSDVDTQLLLTDKAFASPELLLSIARLIAANNVYLRTYDPLQHHGYFVATDLDRQAYPEPFLPVATLEQSTRIFGHEEQSFSVRHVPYADRFAAWHMGHAFRVGFLSERFPASAFDVKRYMSRFALMPVLYLELVHGLYPYKGDVFDQWQKYFTPAQWQPFDVLTSARRNWNPHRGMHFSPAFHEDVFRFAELLLDKLHETVTQDVSAT